MKLNNKTRNTERGIINPNGVIIDGDIAVTTGLEPGKDKLMILRTLLTVLSAYFTMDVLCSFIGAKTLAILPIVLISLSFAAITSGNRMLRIFGIGYLVFQISYFAIMFDDIINGFYIALDKYLKLADISSENIDAIVRKLDPKILDYVSFHFLMFLAAIITVLISLACIVRFDFPIYFIATFPFLEIGLYHGWEPPTVSVVGLFIGWIVVLSVTIINHSTNKAGVNNTFAVHRRKKAYYFTSRRLKGRFFTSFISVSLLICASIFAVTILFSKITGFVRPKSFDKLRENITNAVNDFSIDKLSDFFERLADGPVKEVGPTNGGRLGEKDGIKFDNSRALSVNVRKRPAYTLYLRGYVAGSYKDNKWDQIDRDLTNSVSSALKEYGDDMPIQNYNSLMIADKGFDPRSNTISVGVSNADPRFAYAPYMTDYLSGNAYAGELIEFEGDESVELKDRRYQMEFSDMTRFGTSWDSSDGIIVRLSYMRYASTLLSDTYADYVEQTYRQVYRSEGLDDAFDDVMNSWTERSAELEYLPEELQFFRCIKDYFNENYRYDLNPGKTESGRDFIDYFLSVQKRGYCTYFATAGTMLMRKAGFPARYVEGYVIAPTEFKQEKDYCSVSVTDKSAHAWCEVFIYGVGWVPLEFTPGYQNGGNPNKTPEELDPYRTTTTTTTTTTPATTAAPSVTSGGSNGSSASSQTTKPSTTTTRKSVSGEGSSSRGISGRSPEIPETVKTFIKVLLMYLAFMAVIIAAFIINRRHRLHRQEEQITQNDRSKAVVCIYIYYLKYLSLIGISDNSNVSDEEQAMRLIAKCRTAGIESICSDISRLSELAIQAHLSRSEIDSREYIASKLALDTLKNDIVPERLSLMGRIAAKWLYGLY